MLNQNISNQTNEVQELSLVFINDKEVMTDSLIVAEAFGKRHDHVIRDIEKIVASTSDISTAPKFGVSEYKDSTGRSLPKYNLCRDSLMLLVMGYGGKKAMQIKINYINAFNAMYDRLKLQKSIDEELAEAIKLDEISFMSASEAAKVMKRRQVDKPAHKDNIQRILNKKQKVFFFMNEDKKIIH